MFNFEPVNNNGNHMKRIFIFILFIQLISLNQNFSQTDAFTKQILEIGKSDNRTMYWQDMLSNRFGGRITGSDAYLNSAEWVKNELIKMGLEAELDDVASVPVGFNRGAWFGKMITPQLINLEFVTPSYTAGTKGKQKGRAVLMPSEKNYDSLKSTLKGAWILIDGVSEGLPIDRDTISLFTKKLIASGALGTIQLSRLPIRALDSRTVKSFDDLPVLCDIKLLDEQYNLIKSLIENGEEVILEFDIRNHFKPGPVKYPNVIGVLKGTEFPDEYVILGAHLDSYDVATGSVDNGSGVANMLEAIRMITAAGAKPRRSIMVQLYAAEERGLLGSKSWVQKNKNILDKISIVYNKDSGTNALTSLLVPKVMFEPLKKVAEPLENANLKFGFKLAEMSPFRKAGRGGTDSHSFVMEGVPAPWLRLEGTHKYGDTWHTNLDAYDQIIPEYQEQSSIVIAVLALGTANLDKLLPREGAFFPDGIYADLNTNKGRITLKIDYENVPMTSANFIGLAEGKIDNGVVPVGTPYFNGSIWHRVVAAHVIQAGKPNIKNSQSEIEGPNYEFPNEIYKGLSHNKAGMLGMANGGPHTNGSQFYITLGDRSYLDGNYTLFGEVFEGMDIVNKIAQGDTIKSIAITRIGEKANSFKPTTESFKKMVADANIKVNAEFEKKKKYEKEWSQNNLKNSLTTESGINYIVVERGSGNKLNPGTVIKLKYNGKVLIDKFNFKSSVEGKPDFGDDGEVFEYTIGSSKINPGFDELVSSMTIGEKIIAVIPSDLAYGIGSFYGKYEAGKKRFVIAPHSTLYYEIEIIK